MWISSVHPYMLFFNLCEGVFRTCFVALQPSLASEILQAM